MKKKEKKKKEKMYDPDKVGSFKMQFGFKNSPINFIKKSWNIKTYKPIDKF